MNEESPLPTEMIKALRITSGVAVSQLMADRLRLSYGLDFDADCLPVPRLASLDPWPGFVRAWTAEPGSPPGDIVGLCKSIYTKHVMGGTIPPRILALLGAAHWARPPGRKAESDQEIADCLRAGPSRYGEKAREFREGLDTARRKAPPSGRKREALPLIPDDPEGEPDPEPGPGEPDPGGSGSEPGPEGGNSVPGGGPPDRETGGEPPSVQQQARETLERFRARDDAKDASFRAPNFDGPEPGPEGQALPLATELDHILTSPIGGGGIPSFEQVLSQAEKADQALEALRADQADKARRADLGPLERWWASPLDPSKMGEPRDLETLRALGEKALADEIREARETLEILEEWAERAESPPGEALPLRSQARPGGLPPETIGPGARDGAAVRAMIARQREALQTMGEALPLARETDESRRKAREAPAGDASEGAPAGDAPEGLPAARGASDKLAASYNFDAGTGDAPADTQALVDPGHHQARGGTDGPGGTIPPDAGPEPATEPPRPSELPEALRTDRPSPRRGRKRKPGPETPSLFGEDGGTI